MKQAKTILASTYIFQGFFFLKQFILEKSAVEMREREKAHGLATSLMQICLLMKITKSKIYLNLIRGERLYLCPKYDECGSQQAYS